MLIGKSSADPRGLTPLRVLLVDDAMVILERLVRAFNDLDGVRVIGKSRGVQAAIRDIDVLGPDVVVLDINLGSQERDGWNVLQHVRQSRSSARVFIFSNDVTRHVRQQFLGGGAKQVFDKSLEYVELRRAVQQEAVKKIRAMDTN